MKTNYQITRDKCFTFSNVFNRFTPEAMWIVKREPNSTPVVPLSTCFCMQATRSGMVFVFLKKTISSPEHVGYEFLILTVRLQRKSWATLWIRTFSNKLEIFFFNLGFYYVNVVRPSAHTHPVSTENPVNVVETIFFRDATSVLHDPVINTASENHNVEIDVDIEKNAVNGKIVPKIHLI